jgi:2-(1,2-epoxy-1,2-dihydrophenyl)acetyl-CoA isomerase
MTSPSVSSQLDLRTAGGVAVVTFSNPGRANSLSNQTAGEDLPRLLAGLSGDPEVRAVVLTGAGDAFCAGSELDADGFSETRHEATISLLRRAHRNVDILRGMRKPSIAAVNGAAIGAGLGLALACDIRISSPAGRFGSPYVRMGLTPDMGTSFLLREVVGLSHALELVLSGRTISADAACSMGMVSRIADDPLAEAMALAAEIAGNPATAVASARAMVLESARRGLGWSLSCAEPQEFAGAFHHDEFQSHFAAYRAGLATRSRDAGGRDDR